MEHRGLLRARSSEEEKVMAPPRGTSGKCIACLLEGGKVIRLRVEDPPSNASIKTGTAIDSKLREGKRTWGKFILRGAHGKRSLNNLSSGERLRAQIFTGPWSKREGEEGLGMSVEWG